jgi:hypothetical protein
VTGSDRICMDMSAVIDIKDHPEGSVDGERWRKRC